MTAADRLACARYARRWTGVMNSIPMGVWPRRGGGCLSRLVGSGSRSQILRAGKRILAFHVSDWLVRPLIWSMTVVCREMASSIFLNSSAG